MLVSVITPATGHPGLTRCVESIRLQTYRDVEHLVVIDGREQLQRVGVALDDAPPSSRRHILELPWSTGTDRYNGHRIYGASVFLCRGDLVAFLDEDNWFDPEHLETLVTTIRSRQLTWAYSLRKLVDSEGRFVSRDDCDSLGKWPGAEGRHQVDTNCYLIDRGTAIRFSWIWNRRSRLGTDSADRTLCRFLTQAEPRFDTTGRYTVNYRLRPANTEEGREQTAYYARGNQCMTRRYPTGFPWCGEPTESPNGPGQCAHPLAPPTVVGTENAVDSATPLLNSRFRVNGPRIVTRLIEDELILLNLQSGVCYSMDGVGAEIWELIEMSHTPAEIVTLLAHRYETDREQTSTDVLGLIRQLCAERLVLRRVDVDEPQYTVELNGRAERYSSPRLAAYSALGDPLPLAPIPPELA